MIAENFMRVPALTGFALVAAMTLAACQTTDSSSDDQAAAESSTTAEAETETTVASVAQSDIVDTAIAAGTFNTLVAAVEAAGLVDTLKGDGPYTVFAPTDEAFAALPAGTVDALLLPDNKARLVQILTYHVVPGEVMSADLAGQSLSVATVEGREVAIDGTNGVKVDNATVIAADVDASNGVIHVIDTVLIP